jgi:thiosulfate/3-mercaptopyruvate sulfurtransferase
MTRYVIIGAGAVGVTFGAELQSAGRDVVLAARGAQLAALRAGTMRYLRPEGARTVDLPAVGGPDEIELTADDVLVLATKTQDTETAAGDWAWRPVRQPDGSQATAAATLPIVTLQNGLDAERTLLRRFATVLGGVLWVPATYVRPGEVVSAGGPAVGVVWLGAYPDPAAADPAVSAEHAALLDGIAADFRAANFETQVVPDISRWKAAKLLGSTTFVLDALYEPGELRDQAARLLRAEAREILTAAGQPIADVQAESTVDLSRFALQPMPGQERGNSSWQSLTRSGSLETDFLTGEVVLAARLIGRQARASAALVERVHRAQLDGTPPRSLGPDDLRELLPQLRGEPPAPSGVLVDAKTLREQLDGPHPPAVLDVRWALGDSHGHDHYRDGHIPGAVYADLDTELAAPPEPPRGRHPLPEIAQLQAAARHWGLRAGQPVVVYDNNGGLAAARAWWLLRWAGLPDVTILDGALTAWTTAGFDLVGGEQEVPPGDVSLAGGQLPVLTADAAAALARDGVLLDARAGERYRGETEPVDPRAGHIPGAISAPTSGNLTADGTFAAPAALRARYAALGASPDVTVGVYCGSGVTAAHDIAALAIAGFDAALFPGSWSAWSADARRPAATGPQPG